MKPPNSISKAAQTWWQEILEVHPLPESQRMVLIIIMEAWDDYQRARAQMIEDGGESFHDRYDQPRKHPLSDSMRFHRRQVLDGWKQLGISADKIPSPPTPEDTSFEEF